ncbi:unnamed protein product [Spirodela intermedia]|uniref:Uncharacterized protein n=1 Tax=Spirodela intermedia TaxID=51605 RepID=A0A7I8K1D2_SPIIN|nr:unnamed protein product [Spirodela intermedia]
MNGMKKALAVNKLIFFSKCWVLWMVKRCGC